MAPKPQKEPSCIGGPTKGLEANELKTWRPARASRELKYWSSWSQDFIALTPSVKQPQVHNFVQQLKYVNNCDLSTLQFLD